VARDVCEAALAHANGNQTEAAYKRTDLFAKPAKLMAMWADFLAKPQQTSAQVTDLDSRRKRA
jgi:hypothetical protein